MEPRLQRRVQRYGWNKAAEFYEDSWKEQLKPAQDKVMEIAELKQGETVLETACGTGLVTIRIAKAVGSGGSVTATDLSDEMISLTSLNLRQQNIDHVKIHRMDAEDLDIDDQTFDAAISSLGLMYVPDPLQSVKELHRVIKPGGRACIAIWGERKNCGWAEIFPIVDKQVASDVCPMFFQQGTGNILKSTLEKAGFKDLHIERFNSPIHFSSPEEALTAAFSGGPVALAYKNFDAAKKEIVHSEYLESITSFRKNGGYDIPGEFVVARGYKA